MSTPARHGALGAGLAPPLAAAALAAAALACFALLALVVVGALGGTGWESSPAAPEAAPGGPSALALKDIPAPYLRLYEGAAQRYGLDWAVLAGIGKLECDHGRDPSPSCTREGAENAAGAGGPMQFLASTWASYGVDGDGDGRADRWDAADAIYGAAKYLRASGAPSDYGKAIFAYNHAGWYVREVEGWARRYTAPAAQALAGTPSVRSEDGPDLALAEQTTTRVLFIPGVRARLDPDDGHLALVPAGVPAVVQAMLVAGNELQGLAYGPAGHPDPRGKSEEDCSSALNYVLYRAGVRPIGEIIAENPLAQDYVDWGEPGPGRWVSIYATDTPTAHVFVVIAGLRLDTSHDGTDVGPNRGEDGPRWRIFDRIPSWAHWSVRHPPGL